MKSNNKLQCVIELLPPCCVIVLMCLILLGCTGVVGYNNPECTEAGYIVKQTTESSFHYEFNDDMTSGCPEFKEDYYFTVFVDDTYIKFQVPYQVTEMLHLGDHITISRRPSKFFKGDYRDYNAVICDINVPAVVVKD